MIYVSSQTGFSNYNDISERPYRILIPELIKDIAALQKLGSSLEEYMDTDLQESLTPEICYVSHCFYTVRMSA